jgi:hypothetical protein
MACGLSNVGLGIAGAKDLDEMPVPVNTPSASGGLPQPKSAMSQHYCCAGLHRCSPSQCGQRLRQTEFRIPEHYHTVFASGFLSPVRMILGKLEERPPARPQAPSAEHFTVALS